MSSNLDSVMESFHRCREDDQFIDTFYELFRAKSVEIDKMFEHTDFKRQKLMLRESLLEMLCYDRGMQGAKDEIQKLAHRHHELGVKPEMYGLWLDSLCEAVERHDPQYTPELGQMWRDRMRKGIELMMR